MASLDKIIDVHSHIITTLGSQVPTHKAAAALVDRAVYVTHGCEWNRRISPIAA
jgi:hypothetical protein